LNLKKRQKRNKPGARTPLSKKEIAKRRLKSYQLQSIFVLVGGLVISAFIQYLIGDGLTAVIDPISWPALTAISVATFMAIAIYVKAYSFYLYARLFDLLSATQVLPARPEEARIVPTVQAQPTALPAVPPAPKPVRPPSKPIETAQAIQEPRAPPIQPVRTGKKICPYCGRELPLGDIHVFCPFCGKKLR